MGFWDLQLGDLEARGIKIGEMDEKILEEGGRVLHLRHLVSPFSTPDWINGFFDQNDEPVFVIESLEVHSPNAIIPLDAPWEGRPGISVAQQMDEECGDGWRKFPTYAAVLEDGDRYAGPGYSSWDPWRSEKLAPYRFWGCTPLLDPSVYTSIARSCQLRLQDSLYYEVEHVIGFEAYDDYWVDIGTLWKAKNDPALMSAQDVSFINEWQGHMLIPEEDIDSAVRAYETLIENEIVVPPWHKDGEPYDLKPITLKPIEEYLTDPLGREVWRMLNAQRNYTLSRLTYGMSDGELSIFLHHEGDYE